VTLSAHHNSQRDTDQPGHAAKTLEVAMTTLDTLSSARPDPDEVADAALAMADFDAKGGNHRSALEWLGVAEQHRPLTHEYAESRSAWETAVEDRGPTR
jgi:hypothetical protein